MKKMFLVSWGKLEHVKIGVLINKKKAVSTGGRVKLDIDSEYEMAAHNIDSRDHRLRPSHRTEPGDEGVDTRDGGSGLRRVSLCHPDTPVWSPRRHPRLSVQLQSRSAFWGNFQTRKDKKK